MITDAVKNLMLDNQFVAGAGNMLLSAHTAFSTTGLNITGTKTSANFAASLAGSKALAATTDIAIGAGVTVNWVGLWDSLGTTFKGMLPNGGSDKTFQLDKTVNERIYVEGHGFVNGDKVTFHNGTAPTGLTTGTVYFVVGQILGDPDYFQVALTSGGVAINITGEASLGCVVSKIIEEIFASAGIFRVTTWTLTI